MAIASVIDTLAEDGEEFGLDFDVYWELMYPVLPLYEIKYQPFDKLRVETVAPLSSTPNLADVVEGRIRTFNLAVVYTIPVLALTVGVTDDGF